MYISETLNNYDNFLILAKLTFLYQTDDQCRKLTRHVIKSISWMKILPNVYSLCLECSLCCISIVYIHIPTVT